VARGARVVWLPDAERALRVPLYDDESLAPGMALTGPALVERPDTTILIGAKERARVEDGGDVSIEVADG
jgi:N-methylhydantoinase A